MRILGKIMLTGAILAGMLGVVAVQPVFAANDLNSKACELADEAQKEALGCNQTNTAPSVVLRILEWVIMVLGVVCVAMIVVGGQRYIVSQGDPGKLQQARNMLIYSLIGLFIAILSFAIVSFISNGIATTGATTTTESGE